MRFRSPALIRTASVLALALLSQTGSATAEVRKSDKQVATHSLLGSYLAALVEEALPLR